jgi:hypothetical protein
MALKKKSNAPTDWEHAENENDEWETLPTGFAPLWKPQEGDIILFTPTSVHDFATKKGKAAKSGKNNQAVEGIFKGGSSKHFFTGSGKKQRETKVKSGEIIAVGVSYNFIGEDKIVNDKGELSRMSHLLMQNDGAFRITFEGKVSTDSGRSVNQFLIQVPMGMRQKMAEGPSKKSKK